MMIASNFVQSIEGSSHTAGTTMAPSPLSAPPAIRSLGVRSAYSLEVTKAIYLLSSWGDMSERGSQSFQVFSFQFQVSSFKIRVASFGFLRPWRRCAHGAELRISNLFRI